MEVVKEGCCFQVSPSFSLFLSRQLLLRLLINFLHSFSLSSPKLWSWGAIAYVRAEAASAKQLFNALGRHLLVAGQVQEEPFFIY